MNEPLFGDILILMIPEYDHKAIEKKWQEKWQKDNLYKTVEDKSMPKAYVLDMFPYPSGEGLHVGHPKGYIATDVYSRFKRMNGYSVLHPMGWDAFGLPAENYAIKNKIHPRVAVEENIARYKKQLEILGFNYDWEREINTTDPSYYKWTQWIFLKMFEKGLAFESHEPINWCPSCQTGLANEDLEDGKCERCGSIVEKRPIRQWVLKITDYADRLLEDLDSLDWPESIKESQRNWIGRSEGAEFVFPLYGISGQDDEKHTVKVFTTRPDTLFGVTYIAISAELAQKWLSVGWKTSNEVKSFIEKTLKEESIRSVDEVPEKDGMFTGIYAKNPANGEKIPVWIANYVLSGYGSGAIMAVPAHDERDFEFAKKFDLPIKEVIVQKGNCFILHGCPSQEKDTYFAKHWLSWLKEELLKISIKAEIPIMPSPHKPEYSDWKRVFDTLDVNESTTIVAHSCGAAFAVRWLGETNKKIRKLILVAPAKISSRDDNRMDDLYDFSIDERIKSNIQERIIFVSNDEERHLQAAQEYKQAINATVIEVPNHGHFTEGEMGTNTFPELLEQILKNSRAFTGEGSLINSGTFNSFDSKIAKQKIIEFVEGKVTIQYKLRDWVFSRQRYWGEPIPLIHCETCGVVSVAEKDLPVKLPEVDHYEPTGTGESPLANISEWVNVSCPKCGGKGKRETNTMPQWAGSCWYYLRFMDPHNDHALVDPAKEKHWAPVDMYVGGTEHATRHLIYARFWHKFLFDIGTVSTKEPFATLRNQGLILASDGKKMSKRYGNVINPDDIVKQFGADTMRVYEMFMGPFEAAIDWSTDNLVGSRRFIERIWKLSQKVEKEGSVDDILLNQTIKQVTEDITNFRFNTVVSDLMILMNSFDKEEKIPQKSFEVFLKLLAPLAPHISEEMWHMLGNKSSIHVEVWPTYDAEKLNRDTVTIAVQINGKIRGDFEIKRDATEKEATEKALTLVSIKKWLEDKEVKRVIYVKGKLLNFVV